MKRQSANRIVSFLERFKQTKIDPLIREAGLRDEERRRLDQEIMRHTEEFKRITGDVLEPPKIVTIPPIALNAAKNIFQGIVMGFNQLIITNAPLAIGLLLVVPILLYASWVIKWIPGVDKILPIILGIWLFSLLGIFWFQFQHALKQSLYQAREKALQANGSAQIADRIAKDFEPAVVCLQSKLPMGQLPMVRPSPFHKSHALAESCERPKRPNRHGAERRSSSILLPMVNPTN